MDVLPFLHDFKEQFLKSNYEMCMYLLERCIEKDKLLAPKSKRHTCAKKISDYISDKCNSFLHWVLQGNIAISELMLNKRPLCNENVHYEVFRCKLMSLITQLHGVPATKEHLSLEIIVLYNFLIMSLLYGISSIHEWSDGLWKIINFTLERATTILKNSKENQNESFLFVDNISCLQSISLTNLSTLDCDALYCLSFAVGWLSMLLEDFTSLSTIIKAMARFYEKKNVDAVSEFTKPVFELFAVIKTTHHDALLSYRMHALLIACVALQQNHFDISLHFLQKLNIPQWKYFILYIKSYIYYNQKNMKSAIECCLQLWKSKKECEPQLTSRTCNLLGCCYFIQNNVTESYKWFCSSIDLDGNFLLPVYNLSIVLLHMNKIPAATKALKILENKSCQFISSPVVFQQFLLEYDPEIIHIEANYYCAHHYINLECYLEATEIFSNLLLFLQQNKMEIFSAYGNEQIPHFFQLLYVESAYSFLKSCFYTKCLEICTNVEKIISINPRENPLLSDWIMDIIPSFIHDERLLMENSDELSIGDEKKNKRIAKVKDNLKNIGMYFKNSKNQCIILEEENILKKKLFYVITLLIKALSLYKTSCIQEAICCIVSACTVALNLLQEKMAYYQVKQTDNRDKETVLVSNERDVQDTESYYSSSEDVLIDEVFQPCNMQLNAMLNYKDFIHEETLLLSQLYNNIAIFYISCDQLESVDKYLTMAAECYPGNIDVLYNSCLWELKMGHFNIAQERWIMSKQKLPIIDSILAGTSSIFPFSVSFEELNILNSIFMDDYMCISFDVGWDD